ncbi:helicase [Seminavis robusta]|uniref:Helicase n=1 Tax=Seminavis robusta TaxID=568900 RepID=A0A9N8HFX0_9STRA|nr:helicase [Seminavis robusta]|eukprot:Sro369_g128230.1 helicase (854) ;mRNA; f:44437-46998
MASDNNHSSSSLPTWREVLLTGTASPNNSAEAAAVVLPCDGKQSVNGEEEATNPSLLDTEQHPLVLVLVSNNDGTGVGVRLLHHLAKLEDETASPTTIATKTYQYVALQGLESNAKPVEITNWNNETMKGRQIQVPAFHVLKTLDSPEKILESQEQFATVESSYKDTYLLGPMKTVKSSFMKMVLLTNEPCPTSLFLAVTRAIQTAQQVDEKACGTVLAFIWNAILATKMKTLIDGVVLADTHLPSAHAWSSQLHQKYISTASPLLDNHTSSPADDRGDMQGSSAINNASTRETAIGSPTPDPASPGVQTDACNNNNTVNNNAVDITTENGAMPSTPTDATVNRTAARSAKKKRVRSWQESFECLQRFKEQTGHCNVPREYKHDKTLGEWVRNQRATKWTMSDERRSNLESIGFVFENTQQERSNHQWESYYKKLYNAKLYEQQHAASIVGGQNNVLAMPSQTQPPTTLLEPNEDRALQHWVAAQRQHFKKGTLSAERKAKLDQLPSGFSWKMKKEYKPRSGNDKVWQSGYEKLVEFHKRHNHVNVPKRPNANRPLWEWVYSQRKVYNEGRLTQDRIELMEQLGMVWDTDMGQVIRDQQFNAKYEQAKAFYHKHGHLEVPRSGRSGNSTLVKWLVRQREQLKNNRLDETRRDMLSALDFDWEGNPEQREKNLEQVLWSDGYEELKEYKEAFGHLQVPRQGTPSERRMSKWLAKQQVACQFDDLDPSRKTLLVALGVEFVALSATAGKRRAHQPAAQLRMVEKESGLKAAKASQVAVAGANKERTLLSPADPMDHDVGASNAASKNVYSEAKRILDSKGSNDTQDGPDLKKAKQDCEVEKQMEYDAPVLKPMFA